MSRLVLPALVLALSLSACAPAQEEQEEAVAQSEQRAEEASQPAPLEPPVAAGACDASQAQWASGKTLTAAEVEQARTDSGAESVRTLKPDQRATKDFNDKPLNLDLDAAGVVTAVRCG